MLNCYWTGDDHYTTNLHWFQYSATMNRTEITDRNLQHEEGKNFSYTLRDLSIGNNNNTLYSCELLPGCNITLGAYPDRNFLLIVTEHEQSQTIIEAATTDATTEAATSDTTTEAATSDATTEAATSDATTEAATTKPPTDETTTSSISVTNTSEALTYSIPAAVAGLLVGCLLGCFIGYFFHRLLTKCKSKGKPLDMLNQDSTEKETNTPRAREPLVLTPSLLGTGADRKRITRSRSLIITKRREETPELVLTQGNVNRGGGKALGSQSEVQTNGRIISEQPAASGSDDRTSGELSGETADEGLVIENENKM